MLFDAYQQLASRFPDACPHLFGGKVSDSKGLWLSLDAQGRPYLLFEMAEDSGQPDLKLKSVEVRFACPCDIQLQDGSALSGTYTLVSLANDDPDLIRIFLRLLEEAFLAPGADRSAAAVRDQLLAIADLFTRMDEDRRDVLGFWGELHIIRSAKDVSVAAQAWSSSDRARYDFVTEGFALEVKTTLKTLRQHRFSLEQLRPSEKFRVYIASILLTELPAGETAAELVDQICAALIDSGVRARFFRQCLKKGGIDIYSSDLRFAPLHGGASVEVYDARDLPVPLVSIGDPISNLRFDLDLSAIGNPLTDARRYVLDFVPT